MQADLLPSNPIFLEVEFIENRERGVCFREREGGLGFLQCCKTGLTFFKYDIMIAAAQSPINF